MGRPTNLELYERWEPEIRQQVLKEVGEWLEKNAIYETESGWLISFNMIANLKRGEL